MPTITRLAEPSSRLITAVQLTVTQLDDLGANAVKTRRSAWLAPGRGGRRQCGVNCWRPGSQSASSIWFHSITATVTTSFNTPMRDAPSEDGTGAMPCWRSLVGVVAILFAAHPGDWYG